MVISYASPYGPLQTNFSIELPDVGYVALTGPNNSGKSAILNLAFRVLFNEPNLGPSRIALLHPDRSYVQATGETGGRALENYNNELIGFLNSQPMRYDTEVGPQRSELPRLLLNHTNYITQVNKLNGFLVDMELPDLVLSGAQLLHFANVPVQFQGSGLRGLLAVLAALTDSNLKVVIVDEPESGLEPRLARRLREVLLAAASDRLILTATQSHLMLDRNNLSSTRIVDRQGGVVSVGTITTQGQLRDVVFRLLGNDTADLFFPGNYLVVEGASDQVLCERAQALLEIPVERLKILAAGGVARVKPTLDSVVLSLVPLVVNDSPYATKIVSLIDKPVAEEVSKFSELSAALGDRLYVLDAPSLEEYIPSSLYAVANRDKDADIAEINKLKSEGDLPKLRDYKRLVSAQLAAAMTRETLDSIPILKAAVERAGELGKP